MKKTIISSNSNSLGAAEYLNIPLDLHQLGGSWYQVSSRFRRSQQGKGRYETHHLWAYAAYRGLFGLSRARGASIRMEASDHCKTASWDSSRAAQRYRQRQRSLLEKGKYQEAWMMEVEDIRYKFGTKYDLHLAQAETQLLKLDTEKVIKLNPTFRDELEHRQKILITIEHQRSQEDFASIPTTLAKLNTAFDQTSKLTALRQPTTSYHSVNLNSFRWWYACAQIMGRSNQYLAQVVQLSKRFQAQPNSPIPTRTLNLMISDVSEALHYWHRTARLLKKPGNYCDRILDYFACFQQGHSVPRKLFDFMRRDLQQHRRGSSKNR